MSHPNSMFRWFGSLFCLLVLTSLHADETNLIPEVNTISWTSDLEQAVAENETTNRPILILFSTPWCVACQKMKQTTLRDRDFVRAVRRGCVTLQVDGDQRRDLIEKFQIETYPTLVLWHPRQKTSRRWVGPQAPTEAANELAAIQPTVETSAQIAPKGNDPCHPVGFRGICLVSLLDEQTSNRGNEEFAAIYQGQKLYFSSAEKRDRFIANPAKYWPAANGICTVTAEHDGKTEIGDPRVAVVWKGKVWLFADRSCQRAFIEAPDQFVSDSI